MLFLFQEGSRNAMNLEARQRKFRKNYQRIFHQRLPHLDTVNDFLKELCPQELEGFKALMVAQLIESKVLHKFKFIGDHFLIAIDGVHVSSYDENYCGECLHRTLPSGKTVYFHSVLEAKLVTSSGLSISIASEWIANAGSEYDKQDCELKAFVRLSAKIKSYFPRLPICILGDGLYPNATFFEVCKRNRWKFILTFKEGNLPTVWQEVRLLPERQEDKRTISRPGKVHKTINHLQWRNQIPYSGHELNWIECVEEQINLRTGEITTNRFVQITNVEIDALNASQISTAGRLRWKIENEGFNTQKNQGYGLSHKYSRTHFGALKNYYQCLQIAHMINQFCLKTEIMQERFKADPKLTFKHIWKILRGFLSHGILSEHELEAAQKRRCQIRLV